MLMLNIVIVHGYETGDGLNEVTDVLLIQILLGTDI